ncbi:MAG: glutamyl-tRNA reductase [Waddliaceae bacterium]
MQVGVIGINHKMATLSLREQLAKLCDRRLSKDHSIHGKHAFVTLSTCNRTELYFSSDNLTETHSYLLDILRQGNDHLFDQKLYSYFHDDCFKHLAQVTAGLDSAIIAETEIQGQVKTAYDEATSKYPLPYPLHYLFQKCLKIGKSIRQQIPYSKWTPDLEHAIYHAGCHFFGNAEDVSILFIGASEINRKILTFFQKKQLKNITLCNRTPVTQEIPFLDFENLDQWVDYDWIILATKAQEHLIKRCVSLPPHPKLIMDLSVPRNVDPKMGRNKEITLLNIDQIQRTLTFRQKRLTAILEQSKASVTQSVNRQIALYNEKQTRREQFIELAVS